MDTTSIWLRDLQKPQIERLTGCKTADVCVIGAGIAGILIATALQDAGRDVIVLEAETELFANSQTAGTTAKLSWQHGDCYHRILESSGFEAAKTYLEANLKAIEWLCELISSRGIDCDLTPYPACLYTNAQTGRLRKEYAALSRLGVHARLQKRSEQPLKGSLCLQTEGHYAFHPLKLLSALAKELEIYRDARVIGQKDNVVKTRYGQVMAKDIVVATHFPILNRPGYYFSRMHQSRSYVLALTGIEPPKALYYGIDSDGISLRPYEDLTLFGGEAHRTGQDGEDHYSKLRATAAQYFPESEVVAQWSAQDCITHDDLPYIGRYSNKFEHIWVATGFHKWGMSNSALSARLLCDLICSRKNEAAALYSPARPIPGKAIRPMATDMALSAKNILEEAFYIPQKKLDDLLPGTAAIIRSDGKKTGVYKDVAGGIHMVSAICPHLGCQLHWNASDCTWDCPCHGSRFTPDGAILSSPAVHDAVRF